MDRAWDGKIYRYVGIETERCGVRDGERYDGGIE